MGRGAFRSRLEGTREEALDLCVPNVLLLPHDREYIGSDARDLKNYRPDIAEAKFRANEDLTALNLVAEGLGVTITSRTQIETFPQRDSVFVLPHFRTAVPLCLAYLSTRAEEPAIRAVRDAVLEVWSGVNGNQPASEKLDFNVDRLTQPARRTRAVTRRRNRA